MDKNKIISGSDDKSIKVWDVESGSCIKTISTVHGFMGIYSITIVLGCPTENDRF